jgi:hypothetical protein
MLHVEVAVPFRSAHLVPFKGAWLKPVADKANVPADAAVACKITLAMLPALPMVKVLGVKVAPVAVGVNVRLPVKVPVFTMFNAGQGTVDEVQAKTLIVSGHKVALPSCRISM